jgi:hypothetical protein
MVVLSSTAIALRLLVERCEIKMPHAKNSLGVLLTQDMAVVPPALSLAILGEGATASEIILNTSKLLLMVGGLILGMFLLIRIAVLALGDLTLYRNRELYHYLCSFDRAWFSMGITRGWHITCLGSFSCRHASWKFSVCCADPCGGEPLSCGAVAAVDLMGLPAKYFFQSRAANRYVFLLS